MTPVVPYPGMGGSKEQWAAYYAFRDQQAQELLNDSTPSFFETADQIEKYRSTYGPRAFS